MILSVDTQKVFERYNEAQEAQAAYGEVVATTNKELKEMHEEIEKLGEKVNDMCEIGKCYIHRSSTRKIS